MNLTSVVIMAAVAASLSAQTPKADTPPTLERLCGKLHRVQEFPDKKVPNTIDQKEWNLSHVPVRLYPADGNNACCTGKTPIAETKTSHWGGFELKSKGIPAGTYWLEVEPNGQRSELMVQYSPKKYSNQLCTETFWEVDDTGNLRNATFIIVD
jgi:hypothetical protein